MKPKLKVWVTFGDDLKFGDGRARLLEAAAGFKFVERAPGGGPRRGMRLTRAGKRFLERYRKFQNGLEGAMKRQFDRSFD